MILSWGGGDPRYAHTCQHTSRDRVSKNQILKSWHPLFTDSQICLFITEIYLSIKYVLYQIIHFAQAGETCRHSFSKQVGLWPTGVSLGHVYCERTGSARRNAQVPQKEDACTCHACTHRTHGPFTIPSFPKLHIKFKKDRAFKSVSTMSQGASQGFSKANPKVRTASSAWPLDGQSFFHLTACAVSALLRAQHNPFGSGLTARRTTKILLSSAVHNSTRL